MKETIRIDVTSEVGNLEAVIIHSPGPEVENMTPQSAERALYSDILNLAVLSREYSLFKQILERMTLTFEVRHLLEEVLENEPARKFLLAAICKNEYAEGIYQDLSDLTAKVLARQLIEGVPLKKDNLTGFLSSERYALQPLHNFFFTRDAAITINNSIYIARMRSRVRERESLIMDTIFRYHPLFKTNEIVTPEYNLPDSRIFIEGGDILVARKDLFLIGIGARTSSQGVDFFLEHLKKTGKNFRVVIQELPASPESFIHLDMVFTIIDRDLFMIYEPVILSKHDFLTVSISIENGIVKSIQEEKNLLHALSNLGFDGSYVLCGGPKDTWSQEREQWHSGTNFFALGPGKIMGYSRNNYTLDELAKKGFAIIRGKDILRNRTNPSDYDKFVITIDGSELPRGGGGCRCMTMPIRRSAI